VWRDVWRNVWRERVSARAARCLWLSLVVGAPVGAQELSPTIGRQPPAVRGVALDARLRDDLGLRLGDTLRVGATPRAPTHRVVVSAFVARRADPAEVARREYRARFHLDHLQTITSAGDRVDRFGVALRPGVRADSAVREINRVAFGFRAHASRAVAVTSSRTFRVVERFHRAIGGITIVASALFLLCLLLLSVEERRKELAALRLVGISRQTIVRAIVLEAAAVSLLGSAFGVCLGLAGAWIVNAHFQQLYRTPLAFAWVTPSIVLSAVLIAVVVGTVIGALAAWRIVRTPPLVVMGR
jgi:putative ABC transport system permease protein